VVIHLGYKYPSPSSDFTSRSISLPSLELSDLAPPLHSIVAGEEELHCLDLVAVVLTPAAEIFTPPPP
jgi:hypothetical protein